MIRAFGATVPFSRIENEYLKMKLKLFENKIIKVKSVHVIIFSNYICVQSVLCYLIVFLFSFVIVCFFLVFKRKVASKFCWGFELST